MLSYKYHGSTQLVAWAAAYCSTCDQAHAPVWNALLLVDAQRWMAEGSLLLGRTVQHLHTGLGAWYSLSPLLVCQQHSRCSEIYIMGMTGKVFICFACTLPDRTALAEWKRNEMLCMLDVSGQLFQSWLHSF